MTRQTSDDISRVRQASDSFVANVARVMVGKEPVSELVLVALLCEGHILLEDVPGIGKTMLARAAARSLGCTFKRVQCTPDLLPSDVTGVQYFNQKTGAFEFRPGPVMANVVLVDEINRATPRTQACFLECMQEQQVTVDLETLPLPRPFMIIATQNPVELEGTYPLPEAQLDRFLLRARLGYPSREQESAVLERFQQGNPLESLANVIEAQGILDLQKLCRRVFVEQSVRDYTVGVARATRDHQGIKLGASTRAALGLHLASQALAAIRGRDYVTPDDIKYLAVPVLAHRLMVKTETQLKGRTAEALVAEVLATVPVPV